MTNTIEELTEQKLAIEAELARAITQQQQKQEVIQSKQDKADKDLREKYEAQLEQTEKIIIEANDLSNALVAKLKELNALREANGAKLPSGQLMPTVFAVPLTWEGHNYQVPCFDKEPNRYVFSKKHFRLLN